MSRFLIMADCNLRGSITAMRTLDSRKPCILAFSKPTNSLKRLYSYIPFLFYILKSNVAVEFYDRESKEKFVTSLSKIAAKYDEIYVLPFGEKYIRWLLSSDARSELQGIYLLSPKISYKNYVELSDKKKFYLMCEQKGLPYPKLIPRQKEFAAPYVCKANQASDKENILKTPFLVKNTEDHNKLLAMNLDWRQHFFQEYIDGESYYYCSYYSEAGKEAFFVQRNIIQQPNGGSIVKAEPSLLPGELINKIDAFFKSIEYQGVMMMELRLNGKGSYYSIEVNPRFWGPLQLSVDNGVDFVNLVAYGESKINRGIKCGYSWMDSSFYKPDSVKLDQGYQLWRCQTDVKFKDFWLRFDTFHYYFFYGLFKVFRSAYNLLTRRWFS